MQYRKPGWPGPIVEHMTQVSVALRATHFGPRHAKSSVGQIMDILFRHRSPETRPARA